MRKLTGRIAFWHKILVLTGMFFLLNWYRYATYTDTI